MQKNTFFIALFFAIVLFGCNSNSISPNDKISANINGQSWRTNNVDAVSFDPSTATLLLKATNNGQQIRLFAENLASSGNAVSFSLSQMVSASNLYCPGFDSLGNPLPSPCTYETGFSVEEAGIKWLIHTSCEQDLAKFELYESSDSAIFERTTQINAVGNSTIPNHYYATSTNTPNVGNVWLRTKVIAADGSTNYSPIAPITCNAVFVNAQNVATYCEGTITLTAHDAANHTISGTFALTTKEANGTSINISNGKFNKVSY